MRPELRPRSLIVILLIEVAALATASGDAGAQEPRVLVVKDGAREVNVPVGGIPPTRIEVRDLSDGGKRKVLMGAPLLSVLAALPAPAGADSVVVRCDDGWMSLVSLSTISRYRPVLATAEIVNGATRPLPSPRGPAFLVWPNVTTPAVDREPDAAEAWTWAVASLEYVRRKDALAPLDPPEPASPPVRRGAAIFQKHCLHCHAVRSFGGMNGWDLARPPILKIRPEPRVRAYVTNPRRVNPDGHMPPFAATLTRRDIDALIEYLKTMGE